MEAVAATFDDCWKEEVDTARHDGRRSRPVATGAVRSRLADRYMAHATPAEAEQEAPDALRALVAANLADPITLVNAMQSLAGSASPHVRRVDRSNRGSLALDGMHANLWAPAGVPDTALDVGSAFTSDAERIAEAVRRACRARGVPAVQRRAMEEEVALDPALRPAGGRTVAAVLADASKELLDAGNGSRAPRAFVLIRSLGHVDGEAYYAAAHGVLRVDSIPAITSDAAAEAYVAILRLRAEWRDLALEVRRQEVSGATIPSLIVGRALLLRDEARAMLERIDTVAAAPGATRGVAVAGADPLRADVERVAQDAEATVAEAHRRWAGRVGEPLPGNPVATVPGWTAEELLSILRDVYPRARRIENPIELVPLLGRAVRRVPSPGFTWRQEGAEFLFDRTDALLYAAKQWGGRECLLQATLAEAELERFRDVRFVLPALKHGDHAVRLAAVACLSFLWSDEAREALHRAALTDPEPGVRRAALWGYGFAGGAAPAAVAREMCQTERDAFVRELAERVALEIPRWWAV